MLGYKQCEILHEKLTFPSVHPGKNAKWKNYTYSLLNLNREKKKKIYLKSINLIWNKLSKFFDFHHSFVVKQRRYRENNNKVVYAREI